MLDQWAAKILLGLAAMLGSNSLPSVNSTTWSITQSWKIQSNSPSMIMTAPLELINCDVEKVLQLPVLLYGAFKVEISDSKYIRFFGDDSFKTSNYVFNAPSISCKELPKIGLIKVTLTAYSKSYASISHWPTVVKSSSSDFFFKYSYVGGSFALLLIAAFMFFVTFAKENRFLSISVCSSAFFIAIYQLGVVSPLINIDMEMLSVHRYSDRALSLGFCLFIISLAREGYVSKNFLFTHLVCAVIGLLMSIMGNTGDSVQLGSTVQFPTALVFLFTMSGKSLYLFIKKKTMRGLLQLLISLTIGISLCTEIYSFVTGGQSYSLMPFGWAIGFLIFGVDLNYKISKAYEERDYLRKNLEIEVKNKTMELQSAQAGLIQSAKLASLGTLAAGLAHEINNSVNYVNGALTPLEKLFDKNVPDNEQKNKGLKLIKIMREGLELTVDIIRSLRNYTGLNQAIFSDLKLKEIVDGVILILRSKLRDRIEIENNIDPRFTVYGSTVGLNQIFMNIISNAIDAMPTGGCLKFTAQLSNENVEIRIVDTGLGIPKDKIDRIWEPFYTTKDVGRGTGLGLYIVKKEINRFAGTIDVVSEVGRGTTFIISIPTNSNLQPGNAA